MIFEGTKKSIFFGLGLTRAGANMPDISLLVNIAEIFNVSIPEIINGERKSEIMEKEAKKVAEAMSDYATAEKAVLLKRVKVISIIGLVA